MKSGRLMALCLALVALCSCASYELVQLPARQPDLYPLAEQKLGVWVALDDLGETRRSQRYFGIDLVERGIRPIELIVANHGRERIAVGPADVLMLSGRRVIDPLPLESVSALVKDRGGIVTAATEREIDRFLGELAFRDTVLAPGQSYHGVIFFDLEKQQRRGSRFFRILSLYPEPVSHLNAAVTKLGTRRRVRFGPFNVYR